MNQKTMTKSNEAAGAGQPGVKHTLAPLPYAFDALEPHIDAQTMQLHHDKHHASYVDKLNQALEPFPQLQGRSCPWLMTHRDQLPEAARAAIHNNAGGHLNHTLFWNLMTPGGGGAPKGALADAIARTFGSFESFTKQFDEAGGKVFGSGWVFLAMSPGAGAPSLEIISTQGHDNPIQQGKYALLLNDVWEHAYYLKHQNRRPDYLKGWWAVVNWREVEARFAHPHRPTAIEPADGVLVA